MKFHVPDKVASQRLQILQSRQREITLQSNVEKVGKIFDVLIEGRSKQNPDDLFGRTTHNKVVNIKNIDAKNIGKILKVKIIDAMQNSLVGELN